MSEHHHRSLFSSHQKPFKGKSKAKHRTPKSAKDDGPRAAPKAVVQDGNRKATRVNQNKQLQLQKRQEVLAKKRLGSKRGPPKIVAIVPLSANVDSRAICTLLTGAPAPSGQKLFHITADGGHRLTLFDTPRDVVSILDITKVADVVLFAMAPQENAEEPGVDKFGQYIISLLRAQGMSSAVGLTQGVAKLPAKKQNVFKKACLKWMEEQEGEKPKVLPIDSETDVSAVLRWVANIKVKGIHWRETRAYCLAEALQFAPSSTDPKTGSLLLRGHLRGGVHTTANQLLHITGYGDYTIAQISGRTDAPGKAQKGKDDDKDSEMKEAPEANADVVLSKPTEEKESMISLCAIDPTTQQNIVTDEELKQAAAEKKKAKESKERMTIENDYDEVNDEEVDDNEDADLEMSGSKTPADDEQSLLEKRRREKDEVHWPDEVDIDEDTNAAERFSKYRGLKSFKHTPWNVQTNLPVEYGQIFRFEQFDSTKRAVVADYKQGFESNSVAPDGFHPVTFQLVDVPTDVAKKLCTQAGPVIAWPLFPSERKVSVCHFVVKRHQDQDDQPVKGKEPILFQCGFRRFEGRPVYSQHNTNCDKSQVDRYFQLGRFTVASLYARITFPPASVLMFRASATPFGSLLASSAASSSSSSFSSSSSSTAPAPLVSPASGWDIDASIMPGMTMPLLASGTLLSVDPNKLIIKRAVLTGTPIQCHKRFAIVRYMFFRPDDIRWFRPVELWTKYGLTGHIKEPRGTKGYMKCIFDGMIKSQDTVCMSLYKRQFPPFNSKAFDGH